MFRMTVSDVFFIRGRGTVVTGQVADGVVRVGDQVRINDGGPVEVQGIEAFRKMLEQAKAGDNIGLLLRGIEREDVKSGDVLTGEGDSGAAFTAPAEPAAPAPPAPGTTATSGRDSRFAETETQRTQFLSMREAGLMTDDQIDAALSGMAFSAAGRNWKLTAGGESWYSSNGGEWKRDTPPA